MFHNPLKGETHHKGFEEWREKIFTVYNIQSTFSHENNHWLFRNKYQNID